MTSPADTVSPSVSHVRKLAAPAALALYPLWLDAFHLSIVGGRDLLHEAIAGAFLTLAFAVPALGMWSAMHWAHTTRQRRLAYAAVMAPTLYVFLGVVLYMLRSPLSDEEVWCALWIVLAFLSVWARGKRLESSPIACSRLRIAHGVAGAIVLLFVAFHLGNHLAGLLGPQVHAGIMQTGRRVYRAHLIEPLLIAAMLFQVASGLALAWAWSAIRPSVYRLFQVASGFYLSAFIVGHLNSVFIFAHIYLRIPTDWDFATGAPTGLLHDPWNIRLVPHYALGVFFVVVHLTSGLRGILLAHGVGQTSADRIWSAGFTLGILLAALILAGMCDVRIPA